MTKMALCEQMALNLKNILSPTIFFTNLVLNKFFAFYMMSFVFGKQLHVNSFVYE